LASDTAQRALLMAGPVIEATTVATVPRRVPGHGEVTLTVLACGICGSDLATIDVSEHELIRLHRQSRLRPDRGEEGRPTRHAVIRHAHEHELRMLALCLSDEVGEDGTSQSLAAMVGMDLQFGPRDVRILRIVQAPLGPAEGDHVAPCVAGA